ncbi:MAG: hypothetical protein WAQ98_14715 [Blastocatellia bacterium]
MSQKNIKETENIDTLNMDTLTEDYTDFLYEILQDPEREKGYLEACMEDKDHPIVAEIALRDVEEARRRKGVVGARPELNLTEETGKSMSQELAAHQEIAELCIRMTSAINESVDILGRLGQENFDLMDRATANLLKKLEKVAVLGNTSESYGLFLSAVREHLLEVIAFSDVMNRDIVLLLEANQKYVQRATEFGLRRYFITEDIPELQELLHLIQKQRDSIEASLHKHDHNLEILRSINIKELTPTIDGVLLPLFQNLKNAMVTKNNQLIELQKTLSQATSVSKSDLIS